MKFMIIDQDRGQDLDQDLDTEEGIVQEEEGTDRGQEEEET